MSVVLRPNISPYDVQIITLATSVAVVSAIKSTTGIQARIKWPNDILLDGKKLCGILTEMSSEMERVNYLVVGIGVNVNQEKDDFPKELLDIATSIKIYADNNRLPMTTIKRSDIIKSILYELEILYTEITNGRTKVILDKWRDYSAVLGKRINVISRNAEMSGVAKDITDDGRLIVYCDDGEIREIVSGEVSIRSLDLNFEKTEKV